MHRLSTGWGTWSFEKTLAPAVRLGTGRIRPPGSDSSESFVDVVRELFAAFPASKAQFTDALAALDPRSPWAQPDLAKTLALIAKDGPDAFYKGAIADLIVAEMRRVGGAITKEDLADTRRRSARRSSGTTGVIGS
jgi:gamma-glutamyltranspeptidase/glutathione hydrolase